MSESADRGQIEKPLKIIKIRRIFLCRTGLLLITPAPRSENPTNLSVCTPMIKTSDNTL
jgi:hypothetical protein